MSDQLQEETFGHQKRERESDGAIEESIPAYIPLKKHRSNDFASIRRYLIKKLSRGELKTLETELQSGGFSKSFIAKFFEKEYHKILHWLLVGSENTSSFQFVLNTFTTEAIKNKLRENNFSFLIDVLDARAGMEEIGLLTIQERKLGQERFKLLLQIDPEGIQDFMNVNKEAKFMKPSTWEDYQAALQAYNAGKEHKSMPPIP